MNSEVLFSTFVKHVDKWQLNNMYSQEFKIIWVDWCDLHHNWFESSVSQISLDTIQGFPALLWQRLVQLYLLCRVVMFLQCLLTVCGCVACLFLSVDSSVGCSGRRNASGWYLPHKTGHKKPRHQVHIYSKEMDLVGLVKWRAT